MLPRRQVALFLNRLFSGDGFLHMRSTPKKQVTIDYASKSKRLIQGVQHLLLRFGINSRVRHLSSGHYRLFIHGTGQCRIFLNEIGLWGANTSKKRTPIWTPLEDLSTQISILFPNRYGCISKVPLLAQDTAV